MTQWHMKSEKKKSGGTLRSGKRCDKKLVWKGGLPAATTIVEDEKSAVAERVKGRGNTQKQKLKKTLFVNVSDKKSGKTQKAKVISVEENFADRHFARRNVITKGALIAIELNGKNTFATVTSRPGQHGIAEAVLSDRIPEKAEKKAKKAEKQAKNPKKSKNNEKDEKKE
jgi:small subunit ribosomal protein S8e